MTYSMNAFLILIFIISSVTSRFIIPQKFTIANRWTVPWSQSDYWNLRAQVLETEWAQSVGSDLVLNERELLANTVITDKKLAEIEAALNFEADFLPSIHFFHSQPLIEQSDVYKIIKKLPKGASLHGHSSAMSSFEVLYNLTYMDNLYICQEDVVLLQFFFDTPSTECQWQLVSALRQEDPNFDEFLRAAMNLVVEDPFETYPSINVVWARFQSLFSTIGGIMNYRPAYEQLFYNILKELYEDNVLYVEFRGSASSLYDANGTVYDPKQVIALHLDVIEKFKNDYPSDYFNVRMIYSTNRHVTNTSIEERLALVSELAELYPDFIGGFDLVGQEDLGYPLSYFADILLEYSAKLKYFFHAGETNWNGGPDLNLVDAVLLNSTRIGHGYAITKHPEVLRLIKERQIAIEVNPISNQVLGLVTDVRDHNAAYLIANGFPVVISNDDPAFWGGKALSYDWYMAFMGLTSFWDDLRVLKQFALNSLQYNAMTEQEREVALTAWQKQWDLFIEDVIANNY